jgi:hypothetical protein
MRGARALRGWWRASAWPALRVEGQGGVWMQGMRVVVSEVPARHSVRCQLPKASSSAHRCDPCRQSRPTQRNPGPCNHAAFTRPPVPTSGHLLLPPGPCPAAGGCCCAAGPCRLLACWLRGGSPAGARACRPPLPLLRPAAGRGRQGGCQRGIQRRRRRQVQGRRLRQQAAAGARSAAACLLAAARRRPATAGVRAPPGCRRARCCRDCDPWGVPWAPGGRGHVQQRCCPLPLLQAGSGHGWLAVWSGEPAWLCPALACPLSPGGAGPPGQACSVQHPPSMRQPRRWVAASRACAWVPGPPPANVVCPRAAASRDDPWSHGTPSQGCAHGRGALRHGTAGGAGRRQLRWRPQEDTPLLAAGCLLAGYPRAWAHRSIARAARLLSEAATFCARTRAAGPHLATAQATWASTNKSAQAQRAAGGLPRRAAQGRLPPRLAGGARARRVNPSE